MRRPPGWMVVAGVLAVPLAVIAVRAVVGVDHSPSGDVSLIELRTRDVGTAHNPTLGSYGRYGFNHPGPLWFDVLALPYRLTGQLELGVLAVGVASIALIAWVAARRGGLWWCALLTAVLIAAAGPAFISDPWEPHGLLLPSVALLLLTFDTASGRAWSLPLVAGVASLLGAAQATLLPYAIAMGALALWASRRHLRPVLAAAAVVLVLWAPTIWQQSTGDPTNITQMRDARDDGEDALGLGDAWRVVSVELGHRPSWLGFPPHRERFTGQVDVDAAPLVPIAGVLLLVALVRRRSPIVLVATVAAVAAVVGMSQLLGPVYVWIPQWLRVVGFGCWLAVGWHYRERIPRRALVAGVAAATVLATWRAATFHDDVDHMGDAVRRLVSVLPPVGEPVLASSTVRGNLAFGSGFDGIEVLVLELEKRGIETVVDPRLADRFGPRRGEKKRARDREVILVDADGTDKPPGFVSIGIVDPLGPLRDDRNRMLRELGLAPTASARDILRVVRHDERRQQIADRLLDMPDLPRLELLMSPALAR